MIRAEGQRPSRISLYAEAAAIDNSQQMPGVTWVGSRACRSQSPAVGTLIIPVDVG